MIPVVAHPKRALLTCLTALTAGALAGSLLVAPAPAVAADGVTTATGVIGGAAWRAKVPADWNGTLLLWNHGIRTTIDPNRSPEHAPQGTDGDTTDALLAEGYALVGSAYRSNGFAVRDAVNDDVALLAEFGRRFGRPARTYVWGASLGGLISQTLVEERPDLVTAAAPACGVMAGAVPVGDQVLDTLVMARAFFAPTLKVTGFASDAEAVAAVEALKAAVTGALSNPATQTGAVGRVVAIAVLQGLPLKTRTSPGTSIASVAAAAAEGVLTQAGAAILGSRDGIRRAGGQPATNATTSYAARATPEAVARFAALGLPASLLRSYAATLDRRVARVAASPSARARARSFGAPTGAVTRPVVTMHTAHDPFVTASHQSLFASKVAAMGAGAHVLQLWVSPPASYTTAAYGAGHCTFTSGQWLALLDTLEAFVADGRPDAGEVAALWAGVPGLDQAFVPLPWRGTRA